MGLFSGNKKRMGGISDILNGWELDPTMSYAPTSTADDTGTDPSAPPDAKPKFFGQGGAGRGIAGAIGDYLLQMNHMQPIYAPAMEHQRNREEIASQKSVDRDAEMQQWVQQQQWVRDHPNTASNDTMMDYNFILQNRGQQAADAFLDNKANPTRYIEVDDGQGGKRIVPVGGAQGAQGAAGPQPGTVRNGYRFKGGDPKDPSAWEEMGGAGQAQAPHTFRSPGLFGRR